MSTPEQSVRYVIGAHKIPHQDRDIAHRALADPAARGYLDIIGSATPDDDDRFPVGTAVTYSAKLTEAEAEEFRRASNARYVELDVEEYPQSVNIPTAETLSWMRATFVDTRRWHGRDIPVAILDQGTTQAVRDYMGWTLVARTVIGDDPAPAEIFAGQEHGCLVSCNGVPAGGLLLDALVTLSTGTSSAARAAAGMTWAADLGCKVIVYSFAGTTPSSTYDDIFTYLAPLGVQVYVAAGNDALPALGYPAAYSTTYPGVHSVVAFNEATDKLASFSNYSADASGVASGEDVVSLTPAALRRTWSGTSAAAPHAAQLCARGATGGTYTAAQVAAALDANTRDTGSPTSEQGQGAYDLRLALAALGAIPSAVAGAVTTTVVEALGWAGQVSGYVIPTSALVAVDDLRLVIIASSDNAQLTVPQGWELLRYASDDITRIRVCGRIHRAADPAFTGFFFQSDWRSSATLLTLRAAGGFNLDQIIPLIKFGLSNTIDTVPIDPRNTNDLMVALWTQRHPTAPTGTFTVTSGVTLRSFVTTTSGTIGYPTKLSTKQLSGGARTAEFTTIGNAGDGASSASVVLTVPASPIPLVVTPSEPANSPSAFFRFFARA
jgi:hypothetical protein